MKTKYIFVTGGVLSGLGKGITAASIGNILVARGFSVFMQKFDQYLNIDAGTLNPAEHGEVFVTDDGAETDLDLGHYERFINVSMTKQSSVMSGQIYQSILEKERRGEFLGKTIQFMPHIVPEVKQRIRQAAESSQADFLIVEVGGTVGDYEGLHFIEAIRQMKLDAGRENVMYVHVGFLPYLEVTEELKSKPLQNSVTDIQGFGIQPDIVIARADHSVPDHICQKIALFGNLSNDHVIPVTTVDNVYQVPMILEEHNVDQMILDHFDLKNGQTKTHWKDMLKKMAKPKTKKVIIGLVGKYMLMKDTYLSVIEAVKSGALANDVDVDIRWIDAEKLETGDTFQLDKVDGILVPGGFGIRGIEGKILAAQYAREHKKPYLGLCLGMQVATIEFARHVANLKEANSTEFDQNTPDPVIHIMPDQEKQMLEFNYGGSMRLGAYPCTLAIGTQAHKAYGKLKISERHRHRYEFNNNYRKILEDKGLILSGTSPDNKIVEVIEIKDHPFFVASQFHPEFKSRPNIPHPLFRAFIAASLDHHKENNR